jgi:RecA-family ATPase
MAEKTKAANNAAASDVDIGVIAQIFKSQKGKRLIYKPEQPNPDGTKNIIWENEDVDWSKHISGELLQGGNPAVDGAAVYAVVDVDRSKKTGSIFADAKASEKDLTEQEQICRDAWNIDNKIVVFKSPSGAFHCFKFYHKATPLRQVNKDIKKIEHKLKRKKYNVDPTHTLPTESGGQSGINLPWTRGRIAYAPTGQTLTFNQFVHRYRFQNYPLIAAAAGMHDPGRHDALVRIAAILEKNNKMEYLDDVIRNFGTEFTDDGYIKRIKDKKIHEKYKNISAKGISAAITNIVGFDYELPAADDANEDYAPIKIYRMLDPNYQPQRRSFMLEGYLKKGCMSVIAGEPGVSKTQFLIQMAYSHISGYEFFDKKVNETGNALICTAEEERDEVELRVRACNKDREIKTGFHIDVVAVDTNLKLVKFSKESDQKTKQFTELKDLINKNKYTFIGLDPLISLQAGSFDENNNPQMDSFCKNYLIPLVKEVGACLAVCHHTNKISMITDGGMIDNNALHAARGASSLIGAARIVIGLSPLTRQHWEKEFKKTSIVKEDEIKLMVAIVDAKNNYSAVGSKPTWLRKEVVYVDCKDGQEAVAILTPTNIAELQDSRSKMSQEYARKEIAKHLPLIDEHMEKTHGGKYECSLNKVATKLANLDPAINNCKTTVDEKNLVFRYRTTLQTGLPEANKVKFNGFYYWYDYDNYSRKIHHKLYKQSIELKDEPKPWD